MQESPKNLVPKFFDNTASSYDKVAVWATFGKDKYWKNQIINHIPKCESILDLACGTGIVTRKIAEKFPNSTIIGVDITQSYLEIAKKNSKAYKNISFVHQDAEKLDLEKKFNCIVSSYIPKYCDPKVLIKSCLNHLNSRGTIILHDFTYPKNSTVRALWDLYFVILNGVGYLIPEWKDAFEGLPKLIRSSKWPITYETEMKNNNFEVKRLELTWNSSVILIAKLKK